MGQYRVEVSVRVLECKETEGINPTRLENDSFGIVISEADAESIDSLPFASFTGQFVF